MNVTFEFFEEITGTVAIVLICGVPSSAISPYPVKFFITQHIEGPGGVERRVCALRGEAIAVRGGIFSVVCLPLSSRADPGEDL